MFVFLAFSAVSANFLISRHYFFIERKLIFETLLQTGEVLECLQCVTTLTRSAAVPSASDRLQPSLITFTIIVIIIILIIITIIFAALFLKSLVGKEREQVFWGC